MKKYNYYLIIYYLVILLSTLSTNIILKVYEFRTKYVFKISAHILSLLKEIIDKNVIIDNCLFKLYLWQSS